MASPQSYCNIWVLSLYLFSFFAATVYAHSYRAEWLNHGGDIYNRRHAHGETKISPSTVANLRLKWKFYAGRDISATPAIFKGTLYFPSWNGYLYAVEACDGSLLWKKNIQKLTGINATMFTLNVTVTVSRSTPTVAGDLLFVSIYGPAFVVAIERATGKLVWSTRLDTHPAAVVTMSGTFHDGAFYIGTSSLEEGASIEKCCTFRGSLAKLDARTGRVLWKTFTLPDNHGRTGGYAGAAVWGSSPSIDTRRNHVYIATVVPAFGGYDVYFLACHFAPTPDCPPGPSIDADFGESPMILSIRINGTKRDVAVAVQKSGFAWALDRDNGSIVWYTVLMQEAGPGGLGGGGSWGAATDGKRVYTNIVNSDNKNFTLKPSKKNTTAGGWVAMDAGTGEVLWSTANPSNSTCFGPVTVANGVLFAGSTHQKGPIYAMGVKTGKILWSYETGATVYGGASVSDGCVYVGQGYRASIGLAFPSFTGGTSLFAFCVQ
ncbi:Polyvinyl alcohol dehydrogenase (cytochrome) [Bertholletia excelsa]